MRKPQYRTLFISDFHLGTRGCQAGLLLDFLRNHQADTIYLVGDIIDGWKLSRSWYWPQAHTDVIQLLLARAQEGVKLIYVPGNHDEFMRNYVGQCFGPIEVVESTIHEAADGLRYVVTHGDQFDVVVRWAPWLSALGATIYNATLAANAVVNRFRRMLGFGYWSLAEWTKRTVKNAVKVIGDYEEAVAGEAKRASADGVICGHIHHADIHDRFGVRYVNTGDWMESCTAVVEHPDGRMEVIRWAAVASARSNVTRLRPVETADAA
ncbi:MAG: UDP-2,3-diacylglucosamine diphosphatase [Bauldia sp.]